ncbi:MAG: type II toxin-antitoxin system VapC family toxin [Hormoscilla sp. SP12CHS1]|nr:type II toxin-antitoxin system VapC family toxin [Hormoscilla sp. SP12CHS1]
MLDAVTDTHALIWYLEDSSRLGDVANQTCERGEIVIYVPTICLVEIVYLQEKNRIPADLKVRLNAGLQLVIADLTAEIVEVMATIPRSIVPDMPDRIIAATATHLGLPLISRDRRIQLSAVNTIW